jgi:hypothetical protein
MQAGGDMEFDLWNTLGLSPRTGMAAVLGALVFAGLLALRIFWRNRSESRPARGLSLDD